MYANIYIHMFVCMYMIEITCFYDYKHGDCHVYKHFTNCVCLSRLKDIETESVSARVSECLCK